MIYNPISPFQIDLPRYPKCGLCFTWIAMVTHDACLDDPNAEMSAQSRIRQYITLSRGRNFTGIDILILLVHHIVMSIFWLLYGYIHMKFRNDLGRLFRSKEEYANGDVDDRVCSCQVSL